VLFANYNGERQEMVKELTELSTDSSQQIDTKKTKVMKNSNEVEIKLNGESLDYVPEYAHRGQTV